MIIFLCGKGGSGKDTISNLLLQKYKGALYKAPLYTTRDKRHGETDGKEYTFVSDKEFNKLIKEKKIMEYRTYNTVNGILKYGTGIVEKDKDYIIWGSYEMLLNIKDYLSKHSIDDSLYSIYLNVDTACLLQRMLKRIDINKTSDKEVVEICRRIYSDSEDFKDASVTEFDYIFNNTLDIDYAIEIISEVILQIKKGMLFLVEPESLEEY